jgi:hypothetical protein
MTAWRDVRNNNKNREVVIDLARVDADPAVLGCGAHRRPGRACRTLRDYLEGELRDRLAEFLGGPDAAGRATAAVAVLGGIIFTRYLSPLHPVSALAAHEVRRSLVPALRAGLEPRRIR